MVTASTSYKPHTLDCNIPRTPPRRHSSIKSLRLLPIIKIPSRIPVGPEFLGRKPIAKVRKPILPSIVIDILKVLAAEPLEHVIEVNTTAGVQSGHGAVGLSPLEPRLAVGGPGGARHEGADVLKVVVDGGPRGGDCLNPFGLALANYASNVLGNVLAESEDAAVAYGGVGT